MKQLLPSSAIRSATIQPTARELRWFTHIDRHGPQSSEFLYECTRDTHRCRDTSLRRLQVLREAGYLCLPLQQRQIGKADFNPYVYDLTPLGWNVLSHAKDLERHARPTGHWWHGYWVSAVTSAIEIEATRAGLDYIPAARILAIKNAQMAIPLGRQKLIPDQIFGIKYPEGYRAFALEMDRGTEPVRSAAVRKSLKRSLQQYQEVFKQQLHQRHYGLKCKLAVFWVFTGATRQAQFLKLLDKADRQFLSQTVSSSVPRYPALAQSMRSVVCI